MKKLFLILGLFFLNTLLFAQNSRDFNLNKNPDLTNDTILIVKNSNGTSYYVDGVKLTSVNMEKLLSGNAEAYKSFKIANDNNRTSLACLLAGCGLVGYGIYSYENKSSGSNNTYSPVFIVLGAASFGLAIPLAVSHKKYLENSIKIYNHSVSRPTTQNVKLDIGIIPGGLGARMTL